MQLQSRGLLQAGKFGIQDGDGALEGGDDFKQFQ